MSVRTDLLPRIGKPGDGLVFNSTWRVGTPERQRAAVARTWRSRPWPHAGLLSYSVYTGTDGDTLMHYSQWQDNDAYDDFVRTGRPDRNAEIDAAVPGIERVALYKYELYRRGAPADGSPRPGCIVTVEVEFDGPDHQRQRDWVDAVFDALDADEPLPGGIGAHFHTGVDGTRVLNYAEWESERAHIAALAAPGRGVGSATDAWHRVQHFPGLVRSTVRRYVPAISLSPR
ncbi:Antibiotic biosynthesis monooxygenase [Streptomyces sp. YIM 130001]|uniref:antibiotic biosynthesis monooxygenase n=1 Tax=Streptomyces sp. YIM 130001 TaxID=2259644 RepID=UPI000E64FB36|nr:antibiotic biosynthesis monooxygenase [Streptomyces sp. YIM 130001]RII18509.1 Antibiotic biosynthesis monooxygenase [Streptomyces sp. YIM 130001]